MPPLRLPPPPPSGPPPHNARRLNQSSVLKTRLIDNTSRTASAPTAEGVQGKVAVSTSSTLSSSANVAASAGNGAEKENASRNLVEHHAAHAASHAVAVRTAQQVQTFKAMVPIFSKHKGGYRSSAVLSLYLFFIVYEV